MQADGFSGADLAALLREAGLDVLRQLKLREAVAGKAVYAEQGKPLVLYYTLYSPNGVYVAGLGVLRLMSPSRTKKC